jgi:hypothetical protein
MKRQGCFNGRDISLPHCVAYEFAVAFLFPQDPVVPLHFQFRKLW